LGVRDLGESRPQQLLERAATFGDDVRWHLIGHLQRNKARRVLPLVDCIHSVDTLRLLVTLEHLAKELTLAPRVLLEVNVSGEAAKDGFAPADLVAAWSAVRTCRHAQVVGLMTMAPLTDDWELMRGVFRRLRELRDNLADDRLPLAELSMGMSHDFEIAIEAGATLIRVGSDLFAGLDAAVSHGADSPSPLGPPR
jgi:pyridoxal phosphate enzyme (YggS family)